MDGHRYNSPWRKVCLIAAFVLSTLYANVSDAGTARAQQAREPSEPSESIGQIYIVRPRDSLTGIARYVFEGRVSADDIYYATNARAAHDPNFAWIANPNMIVTGQKLWVPTTLAVAATDELTNLYTAEISGTADSNGVDENSPAAAVPDIPTSIPAVIPALRIADQKTGAGNVIVVDAITASEAGTLYIANDAMGTPGSIIGQISVAAGESMGVQVTLSKTVPFGTELFANLVTTMAPDSAVAVESSTALLPPTPIASMPFRVGLSAGELATQDILTILSSTDEFSVLNSALQTAGLAEGLRGAGPFTVYMPTNEAFSRLSEAQLELLLTDKVALEDVLRYHIVPGLIQSTHLQGTRDMPTLSGGVLTLRREAAGLFVGDAGVLFADIQATNGVIYAIDQVLLPPIFNERLAAAGAVTSTPGIN